MDRVTIDIPVEVNKLISIIEHYNGEAYVVGGAVRDSILGRKPKDYDVATSLLPEKVMQIMEDNGFMVVPTGIKFGTVTVYVFGMPIEVSTFRSDGFSTDKRHPDTLNYKNAIQDDLERRDFAMNAMAYHPRTGLIDPFHGMEDILNKTVRCVGDPNKRFDEDALRMFRAVRFASQLDFYIDRPTVDAIVANREKASYVSVERIRTEFDKILTSDNPAFGIIDLVKCGLMEYICPQFMDCVEFQQNNPHHYLPLDEHIYHVMDVVPNKLHLRLAAFFHDIGKICTKTTDRNGISHFYGHANVSAEIAGKTMHSLKYDNETLKTVVILIYNHDSSPTNSSASVKRFINKLGIVDFSDWLVLCNADIMGQSHYKKSEKLMNLANISMCYDNIIANNEPRTINKLAINGNDLLEMGYPKGKLYGEILNYCLELVIEDPETNNAATLKTKIKEKF